MDEYQIDITNDPYDDYNLYAEITLNEEFIGCVKKDKNNKYYFTVYNEMTTFSVDWLIENLRGLKDEF